jgi:hypothetical protein
VENGHLADPREVRLCDYVVDPVCLRHSQALPAAVTSTQDSNQVLPVAVERWDLHVCDHDNDAADMEDDTPGIATLPGASVDDTDGEPKNDDASYITPVLGLSIQEFAAPVAQLTDQEEMVLSLVHPLVQVYTLPRTGQLAYVGHVCNFRQKVTTFFSSLPILPRDMPFVMVRPRTLRHRTSNKMAFKVNVEKLRAAFLLLKANNP